METVVCADDCFEAAAIMMAKCHCGCGNTRLYLHDRRGIVRATACSDPDDMVAMAKAAKTMPPMLRIVAK